MCGVLVAIMFFTVEFTLGARCVGVGPSHEATSPRLSVCTSRFALSGVIISTSGLSTLVEFTVWLFKLWANKLARAVVVWSVERPEI